MSLSYTRIAWSIESSIVSPIFKSSGANHTHAVHLQIVVQAPRKMFVLRGIGNERGIILDGFADERFGKRNHFFWHTAAAQEDFGDIATR